jgi:hypothetical protein
MSRAIMVRSSNKEIDRGRLQNRRFPEADEQFAEPA